MEDLRVTMEEEIREIFEKPVYSYEEANEIFYDYFELNKMDTIFVKNKNLHLSKSDYYKAFYFPIWSELKLKERLQVMVWMYEDLVSKLNLQGFISSLIFIHTPYFNTAGGCYNKKSRNIYLNPLSVNGTLYKSDNFDFVCIQDLAHEFCHVKQHKEEVEIKNRDIKDLSIYHRSFAYYCTYDGTVYRFCPGNDKDFTYKLERNEEFCTDLYFINPMEVEASKFGNELLHKYVEKNLNELGHNEKTTNIMNLCDKFSTLETTIISKEDSTYILKLLFAHAELNYQYSLCKLNEDTYSSKTKEIDNLIDLYILNNTKQDTSFNIEEVLDQCDYFR